MKKLNISNTLFLMVTITRRLPNSNKGRRLALNKAKAKNDTFAPGSEILNAATTTRLDAAQPANEGGTDDIVEAEANLNAHTVTKNTAVDHVREFAKSFIVVFDSGVRRGKYLQSHRHYFNLDEGSSDLPPMDREDDLMTVANDIVTGDANRVTAGGAAMSNPDATEVQAKITVAQTLLLAQSALSNTLRDKRNVINDSNADVDSLIKRIWDETETFYGEHPASEMRDYARQMGVVYVTEGPPALVSVLVKVNGTPAEGAVGEIEETGANGVANQDGRIDIETTVLGAVKLRITYPGKPDVEVDVTIPEHEDDITVLVPDVNM